MGKPVEVTVEIKAGVEQVFEVFTDLENAAERIADIQKLEFLTDGPVGKGFRWRETRMMFNKEAKEEMEITDFQPPKSFKAEAESHGAHYTSIYRFEPTDQGTKVAMTFEARPLTFIAKIMTFLTGPMMRGMVSKCLTKDMTDLKKYLESNAAA